MLKTHVRRGRSRPILVAAARRAHATVLLQLRELRTLLTSLRAPGGWRRGWRSFLPLFVYATAFVVAQYTAALLAFALSPKVEAAIPLYIQGAVTVSALLLVPRRRWWHYLLVTLLVLPIDVRLLRLTLSAALVWVLVFVVIILACTSILTVSLVRRYVAVPLHFADVGEIARFVACVAAGAVPAAFLATALRSFVFSSAFWFSWETSYVGYVLGLLVFTPVIVLWLTDGWSGLAITTRWRTIEIALLGLTTLLASALAFARGVRGDAIGDVLIYLLVPLFLWAAVRFGPQAFASTLSLATAIAILGAVNNRGPFAEGSPTANVLALQLYLLFVGVPVYFLAALVQEREVARAEAERQADQLDRVFEQAGEGLTLYDAEGLRVRANAAQTRLLGLDAAPPGFDQLPLDERAIPYQTRDWWGRPLEAKRSPVRRALRGETTGGAEAVDLQLRTWDGRDLDISASAAPLRDRDGRVIGAIGVFRDQTERRRLEREREEAWAQAERRAEELDRVFEAVADGVAVYDARGRLVRMNAALRRLEGWDAALPPLPDEAHVSLPERLALFAAVDNHDRPLGFEEGPLPRAVRGEAAVGGESMDLRARTLDGRVVDLNVSAATLRDPDGRVAGAVAVFRDQTEGKRLERQLSEQAEQLDRILGAMGEGLFVYDLQGRIVRTNPAGRRLLGLDAAAAEHLELLAEARLELYVRQEGEGRRLPTPSEWLAARALDIGGMLGIAEARDVHMRALDGREVEVGASVAPLHDRQGRVAGAVLLLSDRTERNQLAREREEARAGELAMRELNRRLDTFVAMAAHDLRSPVAVSKIEVGLAQRQVERAAAHVRGATVKQAAPLVQAASALARIDLTLDRLGRLMRQLLDVSRIREGALKLERQPVNLVDLVRASVEEQRLLTPSRVLALDLGDSAGPASAAGLVVVVDADADRIGQVLANYLANAVRYSPEDQPVAVTLRVDDASGGGALPARAVGTPEGATPKLARVEVRDQGWGIPPEEQRAVWERFQRAQSVAEASGLGLGLYIARMIVELHGGQVGVESVVGQGSTFWFTLPQAAVHSSREPSPGSPSSPDAGAWGCGDG